MALSTHDRTLLRGLAKAVAEVAATPATAMRRQKWVEHNALRSTYPMMLIFPEGSWEELLPRSTMKCYDAKAREIECNLRTRLYMFRHFQDDAPIAAEWIEKAVITDTGWGYEPLRQQSTTERGAYAIKPFLTKRGNLQKLHIPETIYDEKASQKNLTFMQDLLGDILVVRFKGKALIAYSLAAQYVDLRGLEGMFLDLAEAPDFVHEVMTFLTEGHRRTLQQWVALNLLSLNNDGSYQSSGGVGCTDLLPAPGFDPTRVRPCDMWASAQSQEFALVSPKMHDEFMMQYEARLLEPFGLTGYGCCEDLSKKLASVRALPHMRRISCSPFADVDVCAEKLKGDFIFSWKPNPADLVGGFEPLSIRRYVRHTLDVTQANNCVLEMILKDTHTCEHHPERFDEWTRIAREEIEAVAGVWRALS